MKAGTELHGTFWIFLVKCPPHHSHFEVTASHAGFVGPWLAAFAAPVAPVGWGFGTCRDNAHQRPPKASARTLSLSSIGGWRPVMVGTHGTLSKVRFMPGHRHTCAGDTFLLGHKLALAYHTCTVEALWVSVSLSITALLKLCMNWCLLYNCFNWQTCLACARGTYTEGIC